MVWGYAPTAEGGIPCEFKRLGVANGRSPSPPCVFFTLKTITYCAYTSTATSDPAVLRKSSERQNLPGSSGVCVPPVARGSLPAEIAEAIKASRMDPAHDHLNALLDD
jgi:hypothetical protein